MTALPAPPEGLIVPDPADPRHLRRVLPAALDAAGVVLPPGVPGGDPAAAVRTIQELCQTRLPKNMGIAPADIQVLSPSRKHETGTKTLNLALQAVLNPPADGKKEKKHGDFSFRIGDRVMQIRNNYDIMWKRADGLGAGTGIFNGDIGCITQIATGTEIPILHTVELLDWAYGGERPAVLS